MATLFSDQIYGLERCPHCSVSKPLLSKIGDAYFHIENDNYYPQRAYFYFTARCSYCMNVALFYGYEHSHSGSREAQPKSLQVERSYPRLDKAAEELPEIALRFLQQAMESLHAPDGALMLAASSIDAMLKDKGYLEGSLYKRILNAGEDGLLTDEMAAWAHEIRLSANEPRHADENFGTYILN